MENVDLILIKKFPKLRSLAEDLESTLTVAAYSDIKDVKTFVIKRQKEFKEEYGVHINCGRYGQIYCGEPNTLYSYNHEEEPDTEKRIAKIRDNIEMLSISTFTSLEDVYMQFMQMLSPNAKAFDIRSTSEELLNELVSATGGLVGPVPEEMVEFG